MSDNYNFEDRKFDARQARQTRRELKRQWRRNSGVFMCTRTPAGRMFFAVFLIVAGVALFLDNVGVLRLRNIWEYSPLLMVAWGVSVVSSAPTMTRRYWGVFLMVLGVLGLLLNLGVLQLHTRDDSWLLALLLIAGGLFALIRTVEGDTRPKSLPDSQQQPGAGSADNAPRVDNVRPRDERPEDARAVNMLNDHAIFGSVQRRVETPNFLGGQIECTFGSVELDLRHSQIVPNGRPVTVDVKCVFGSVEMRVPDTWLVIVQAAGVFGSVEDKTIPPRTGNGAGTPTLMITGEAVFSSVEVEN